MFGIRSHGDVLAGVRGVEDWLERNAGRDPSRFATALASPPCEDARPVPSARHSARQNPIASRQYRAMHVPTKADP